MHGNRAYKEVIPVQHPFTPACIPPPGKKSKGGSLLLGCIKAASQKHTASRCAAHLCALKTSLFAGDESCFKCISDFLISTPFPDRSRIKFLCKQASWLLNTPQPAHQGQFICSPDRTAILAGQIKLPQPLCFHSCKPPGDEL